MSHCHRYLDRPMTRRQMLHGCAGGIGAVALASMLTEEHLLAGEPAMDGSLGTPHFAPRARNVIFLYMDGGPSQVDTFDPKPRLQADGGKPFPMKMERTQFNDNGAILASPWSFQKHGECGHPISALFPHLATCADHLCMIRSMTSPFSEHTNANYFLHTGLGVVGRPSMGAWVNYGLGSVSRELPSFVVLNGGLIPPGGLECFGSGFLPADNQGSIFTAGEHPVANIHPGEERDRQQRKRSLVQESDHRFSERMAAADAIESSISNYETAFLMQWSVPELMELEKESEATRRLYGLDAAYEPTRIYARQCLLARRLVERGVRFIELTCPSVSGDRWDQHNDLRNGHENNARAVDQPVAGLLKDLHCRGLLEETLVIWAAEFGRTPFAQGSNGRDHNPYGFTIWMAGGGTRAGTVFGSTDEYGYRAVEHPLEIHDLHATMLHLMGINHRHLTFLFGGRDMRLTDVHGHVIHEVIA